MRIVVCIKHVPDVQSERRIEDGRLVRGEEDVLNELDENAVEAAVALAEEADGEVIALTMGPEDAEDGVRRALQMGADSGVVVADDDLAGADVVTTARVLAAAVALAGRGEEAELAELARRAWSAAAGLRTIALNGAQADGEAVARAVASALRPSDELLTVITGRHAGRDVGALAASAAVGVRGQVVGEDVEVAVHAGGQEHPDVLIAIE